MNWIPAVILVVGFINCDQEQAQPVPPATPDVGAMAKADVAATPKPDPTAKADQKEPDAPFLWQVTKEGNHRTSWLLGTIQNPQTAVEFELSPESMKLAMTQSSHAMLEVPTGSAADRDRTKLMPMKSGSLRKEIGSNRVKKLAELTKHKTSVLDVMNPWVVYLALEEKLAADPPMDEAWEGYAQSYRKRLVYLESVHEQVSVLEKVIDFDTVENLVDEFSKHEEAIPKIAQAYAAGSKEQLAAALLPPDDNRTKVYNALAENRVPRWAAKLEAQFAQDATVAIVDTRYLIGPTNLVDALREKGWKVERVTE